MPQILGMGGGDASESNRAQEGCISLLSAIARNGYQILYLNTAAETNNSHLVSSADFLAGFTETVGGLGDDYMSSASNSDSEGGTGTGHRWLDDPCM